MKSIKQTSPGIENRSLIGRFKNFNEGGVLLALVLLCLVIGIFNPVFFSGKNLIKVLRQFSAVGIIAVGGAFVIVTGGIDLSVGSFMAFGAVGTSMLISSGVEPVLALLIMLALSAIMGLLSGLAIVKLSLNPFIVTLSMMYVVSGITYLISNGIPIKFNNYLNFLGGSWANIPVSIFVMLIIMVIGHILLSKTEYGRKVFAVGGNANAAKLSGIKVEKIKCSVYAMTALLGCLTGIISAANLNSGDVSTGSGYELSVIAACVIGGCSLSGGEGTILGVFFGAAVLGVIKNGFVLLKIPASWQTITIGLVIILACTLDQLKRRNK
ncbi:MAG: ABC transporter permease [Oscillospiraceae bacterium]|nr:ABC transporter permease [Oscillospiraceae bacterium]